MVKTATNGIANTLNRIANTLMGLQIYEWHCKHIKGIANILMGLRIYLIGLQTHYDCKYMNGIANISNRIAGYIVP